MKLKFEITKIDGQQVPTRYGEIRLLTNDDVIKLIELQQIVITDLHDP